MGSRGQGPVGLRLALAFVAVAVLAVALVAGLVAVFADKDIGVLVQQRRDDLTRSLITDAVATYNAQAGRTPGSGIGLAVSAELARAQHGTIEVSSKPGHGSRFTLILPLAQETAT